MYLQRVKEKEKKNGKLKDVLQQKAMEAPKPVAAPLLQKVSDKEDVSDLEDREEDVQRAEISETSPLEASSAPEAKAL